MKFKVINDIYTEVTRERDPTDEWDADDTHQSNSIRGISLTDKDSYYELDTEFALYSGTDYYLVYGIYSTGDSFSQHEGEIAFVQLYLTKEYAERCVKVLKDHDYLWSDRYYFPKEQEKEREKEKKAARKKDKYADQHAKIQLESGK